MLAAHPEIEIAAECANGFEAVKAIAETAPGLLFLDVQMPKLDGFEVLELISTGNPNPPAVIFVTAYDQYAMRAFDAHAVDYLLKPFSVERFERALERAKARLGQRIPPVELSGEARAPERKPQRIVVKDGTRVHVIPLEKLDYVEAQGDYVALHSGGRGYLKQQPISALESVLDPSRFVRVHRSTIVNLERITAHRAVRQGQPRGDSGRWDAPGGEPRRLRPADGRHGRVARQQQHHAIEALARRRLENRRLAIPHPQPAPHVRQAHPAFFAARAPPGRTGSRWRCTRPPCCRRASRRIVPPSTSPAIPCLTAFSTSGCNTSAGTPQSSQSASMASSTLSRSPKRTRSTSR